MIYVDTLLEISPNLFIPRVINSRQAHYLSSPASPCCVTAVSVLYPCCVRHCVHLSPPAGLTSTRPDSRIPAPRFIQPNPRAAIHTAESPRRDSSSANDPTPKNTRPIVAPTGRLHLKGAALRLICMAATRPTGGSFSVWKASQGDDASFFGAAGPGNTGPGVRDREYGMGSTGPGVRDREYRIGSSDREYG